jgi:hypothetical protein
MVGLRLHLALLLLLGANVVIALRERAWRDGQCDNNGHGVRESTERRHGNPPQCDRRPDGPNRLNFFNDRV